MRGSNREVAAAFLGGLDATNGRGSLRSERKLGHCPSLRSYAYLLAWRGPGSGRVYINHEPTGQVRRSGRHVVRIYDLAQSPTTQRHRAELRSALVAAGYRKADIQPEPLYERWEVARG